MASRRTEDGARGTVGRVCCVFCHAHEGARDFELEALTDVGAFVGLGGLLTDERYGKSCLVRGRSIERSTIALPLTVLLV